MTAMPPGPAAAAGAGAAEPLTIRPYVAADLEALIDVFLRAVRETAGKDYTPAQIAAWAQADRGLWAARRLSRPTWVAVAGGAVAGFADLEASGHLDMLYVHPAHQGRGVASALLARAEAAARAQGIRRLFTYASLTARPFFERRGFKVVAPNAVEVRGERLANFRMEKPLGG